MTFPGRSYILSPEETEEALIKEVSSSPHFEGRWRILALLMLGMLPSCLDVGMVNVILPTLAQEFQADIHTLQWVPGLHRMMMTGLLLICGKLGDRYGHSRLFLVGLAGWTFISATVGLSQNINQIIFLRALQGIVQAIKLAMPFAIITAVFPPQERGRAIGLHASCIAVGTGLGPIFGGVVSDLIGWRYLFFINSAIALFALSCALRWLPREKAPSPVGFDTTGGVTLFLFLSSLILWAGQGRAWGWTSSASLSLLSLTLLSGLAVLWIERRVAHPLLELNLFSNLTLSLGTLAAFFNYMAQYMVLFITPFYLQFVLRLSLSNLGIVMAAIPLVTLVVAPLSGSLSDRIGSRPLMLAGTILCTFALFSMSWLDVASSPLNVAWRLALFGLGAASFISPNNSAIMSSVNKDNLGVASGILNLGRNLGWSLGLALAGTVLYGQASGTHPLEEVGPLLGLLKAAYIVAMSLSAAAFVVVLLTSMKSRKKN